MLIPMPADIMTRSVVSIKKTMSIFDAMELMAGHRISGLPVVDDQDNLIGVHSEKDFICQLGAPEQDEEKTVEDFMTQPAIYFEDDESLIDICDFLKKNVFRRVPIASKGKLVGIVSVSDVLEFILRLRGRVPVSAYSRDK
jgi:CBS domain-containing protein